MPDIPYPALLTTEERTNLEASDTVSPLNFVYFTFNSQERNVAKSIITLPVNSMVYGVIMVQSTEPFESEDAVDLLLQIGTVENKRSIGQTVLVGRTIFTIWPADATLAPKYFKVFQEETIIYVTVSSSSNLLQGRGIGVLQWLDMNRVKGFRDGT